MLELFHLFKVTNADIHANELDLHHNHTYYLTNDKQFTLWWGGGRDFTWSSYPRNQTFIFTKIENYLNEKICALFAVYNNPGKTSKCNWYIVIGKGFLHPRAEIFNDYYKVRSISLSLLIFIFL